MSDRRCHFEIHGVTVEVSADHPDLVARLAHDLSFFGRETLPARADISLTCHLDQPPWEALPAAKCVMVQPAFVAYGHQGQRWVDYQGRGLSRWDFAEDRGELWSREIELLHEIAYLLIQSRVGERLDRRGLHRVHALGLAVGHRGVLCLLPSGGGKTTLGRFALELPGVRLLADDAPLVSRRGLLVPFPVRIGCTEKPSEVPEQHLRRFCRRQHGAKWLIDVRAYGQRIASEAVAPAALLLGQRQLRGDASIEPLPRRAAAPELFRSLVVGLGLPQVVEYFLRLDLSDLGHKSQIVGSRALACAALLSRARSYRFLLARDSGANAAALETFLQRIGR
jgi:hypothetical protein